MIRPTGKPPNFKIILFAKAILALSERDQLF